MLLAQPVRLRAAGRRGSRREASRENAAEHQSKCRPAAPAAGGRHAAAAPAAHVCRSPLAAQSPAAAQRPCGARQLSGRAAPDALCAGSSSSSSSSWCAAGVAVSPPCPHAAHTSRIEGPHPHGDLHLCVAHGRHRAKQKTAKEGVWGCAALVGWCERSEPGGHPYFSLCLLGRGGCRWDLGLQEAGLAAGTLYA